MTFVRAEKISLLRFKSSYWNKAKKFRSATHFPHNNNLSTLLSRVSSLPLIDDGIPKAKSGNSGKSSPHAAASRPTVKTLNTQRSEYKIINKRLKSIFINQFSFSWTHVHEFNVFVRYFFLLRFALVVLIETTTGKIMELSITVKCKWEKNAFDDQIAGFLLRKRSSQSNKTRIANIH